MFALNLDTKANIELRTNTFTVKELIAVIEEQTDFLVLFRNNDVDVDRVISLKETSGKLVSILDESFRNTGINYEFRNKYILLSNNKSGKDAEQQTGRRITGIVVDENGEPLIGASVVEKGTTNGVSTAADGRFTLTLNNEKSSLQVSYLGYITREVSSQQLRQEAGKPLVIRLSQDNTSLEEVVVVGYGVTKRSELTGSVASLRSDDIKDVAARSLNEVLTGRIAGIQITQGSGSPGSEADILIRGASSINNVSPLYVVDGIPQSTGFKFNMKDVESIEVLRDAASSAIYGARAAGGVILVTTKKGAKGEKTIVDFNARYGIRSAVRTIEMLGRDDYVRAKRFINPNYLKDVDISTLPNTDWVDELYSPAPEREYFVSLSGGTEKANYYLSTGYYREDGIRIDNYVERYSLRVNGDYQVSKHVTVGETLYGTYYTSNPVVSSTFPFRPIPIMPVYDETNPLGGWGKAPAGFAGDNVVASEYQYHTINRNYEMRGMLYVNINFFKGLDFRVNLGGDFAAQSNRSFQEAYDYGPTSSTSTVMNVDTYTSQVLTANEYLTFEQNLFEKHNLKVMLGHEAKNTDDYYLNVKASDFVVSNSETIEMSSDPNKTASDQIYNAPMESYFGRLNYNYDGRYFLSGLIRNDGSSVFGKNYRRGWFPSVSGAWRFSEESFIKDRFTWLFEGKLRGGYGVIGNDGVAPFLYENSYGAASQVHAFNGERVQAWDAQRYPNRDIRWESVTTTDIGLDLSFLGNRLTFSYDWYRKYTYDMIYPYQLPITAGWGTASWTKVFMNIGTMQGIGNEFTVGWKDRIGKKLSYAVGANAAFNRNKILHIGVDDAIIDGGSGGPAMQGFTSRSIDGQPLSQFYGYIAEGIFQTQTEVDELNAKVAPLCYQSERTRVGDLRFADIDGNGYIDQNDKTWIGNPWPKMQFGFNIDLTYDCFDFSAVFSGSYGMDIFNGIKPVKQYFLSDWNTSSDIFRSSFFENNGVTDIPRMGYTDKFGQFVLDGNNNFTTVSSYFVEDGSFLKLKNLSFGVTLPRHLGEKVGMSKARLFVVASNVFTLSKYTGYDPELSGGVTQRGIETPDRYLPTRMWSVGLDITF
jgi:TonB-linked SusC/RagA family outer membrane protein